MELLYFTVEFAIKEHDFIIDKSGGRHGILNRGLLESVLEHIKNDEYYPTLEDKLTYLFYSINKNHAFNDGNKRSAIVLSAYFLEINGLTYILERFIREMENIAVFVADNLIDNSLLHKINYSILYEDDFNEELQLEIIQALYSNALINNVIDEVPNFY